MEEVYPLNPDELLDQDSGQGSSDSGSGLDEDYLVMLSTIKAVQVFVYVVIFVIGVTGNGIVLVVLARKGKRRPICEYFFANLALSDIGVLLIYMPFFIAYSILDYIWPFGEFLCKAVFTSAQVFLCGSIFTLVAVSIERHSLTFGRRMNKSQARQIICIIWTISILISIPQFVLFHTAPIPDDVESKVCLLVAPELYFKIGQPFDLLFLYVGPMLFTGVLYARIIQKLRQVKKKSQYSISITLQNTKAVKILVTVTSCFAILLLPLHIWHFVEVFHQDDYGIVVERSPWMFPLLLGLYFVHHAINPIIYGTLSPEFRARAYSSLMQYMCKVTKKH